MTRLLSRGRKLVAAARRELAFRLQPGKARAAGLAGLREKTGAFVSDDETVRLGLIKTVRALAHRFGDDREVCEALSATVASLAAGAADYGMAVARAAALAAPPGTLVDKAMTGRLQDLIDDTLPEEQAYFKAWENACAARAGSTLQARSLESWRFKSEIRLKQMGASRLREDFQECANHAGGTHPPARELEKTAAQFFGKVLRRLPPEKISEIYVGLYSEEESAYRSRATNKAYAPPIPYTSPQLVQEAKAAYQSVAAGCAPD